MYLDKIEIHGFKSFGNAVKLNIPKGITAVIGPNGSGKSNVSDAIRWVLGEQSAKSLRGSKMEDIIFAGTEKRKSLGYAEVSMTIKNPDETVRIAYTEIVIKRRVYRSGESEYFINGSSCRLKDVQELFMDTGIGRDGYSIIGQGQIDRVLSSKPEDRRSLFEEAAGVYKYKVRKIEAERKLEKQKENIVRILDIMSEIEGRLLPLSEEAEKTASYLKLRDELKSIDINVYLYEIDRLEKEVIDISNKIQNIYREIKDKDELHIKATAKSEICKKEKEELYNQIESLIQSISEDDKDKERKLSQITINNEKKINVERLVSQVYEEQQNQKNLYSSKKEKLSYLETKKTALEIELASKQDIVSKDKEKLNNISTELLEIENKIATSKTNQLDYLRQIDALELENQKNEGLEEQLSYRNTQISEQMQVLNSEIQHQEVGNKVLQKSKDDKIHQKIELEQKLNVKQEELQKVKMDYELKTKTFNDIKQDIIQTTRQHKWYLQLKSEHEGYIGSVKKVLELTEKNKSEWQGIVGVVGELIEVPQKFEVSISTALGGAIQNIVTLQETDAKRMIKVMKERAIGRVTFLPLDTIRTGYPINEHGLKNEDGFLGLASEIVNYNSKYEKVISYLLGRILIVENMDKASVIAKKYNYKYKIVTLQGEVFNSGGSLTGGSLKNQSGNLFSRTREMKEVEDKLTSLKQNEIDYTKQTYDAKNLFDITISNLNDIKEKYTSLDDQIKQCELELDKSSHSLKLIKSNQIQMLEERSKIEDSLEVIKKGEQAINSKLEELKSERGNYEIALNDLEDKLKSKREYKEEIEAKLTDKKIGISATTQDIQYIDTQLNELEQDIGGQDERQAHLDETIAKYKEEIKDIETSNEIVKNSIDIITTNIAKKHEERKRLDENKVAIDNKQKEVVDEISILTESMNLLREEKYRLENRKENSELQKNNFGNSLWEQYELTFNHALEFKLDEFSIVDLKKQSVDIRGQIKQIGTVNVNAIEEYEETKQRYTFLETQKTDMEKAEETLLLLIDELLKQMEEIFSAQFKLIAENFTEVFKELFGGGEAYLKLMDEENILESGIEIIAKPPGKKLQNMTLLSGGERTLTAISLIFGILKLKPSPFCILDEIEAALDDANVVRFANYLDNLSSETQFIVITHRKGTMERADTLYGVTMQERGVSTILSIQLGDVNQYIEEKKTS